MKRAAGLWNLCFPRTSGMPRLFAVKRLSQSFRCLNDSAPKPEVYAPREPAATRVPTVEASPIASPPHLLEQYNSSKASITEQEKFDIKFQNPRGVFANNELELGDIDVFGFDYDYTLAAYNPHLHPLIYEFAKNHLVTELKYPREIADLPYNPAFSVRGLHFDIGKSLLMKIDSYHNIELGTVYRGLTPVTEDEVREMYGGTHIPLDMLNNFYGKNVGPSMVHLIDLFSPPETMLLSNTIEYFCQKQIAFDSEYVYWDVWNAIQSVHTTGAMHKAITTDVAKYLLQDYGVRDFLIHLHATGKKIFLITNSGFSFIDAGLKYIVGSDWKNLFDVIVCQARKPKFFYQNNRPFRKVNFTTDSHSWDRVINLHKGEAYIEGNLSYFLNMTGWKGSQVLYFGDHVYSDLADAALKHGWRTGAIIPELEREIETQSSTEFVRDLTWLTTLQLLVEKLQALPESRQKSLVLESWLVERDQLRLRLKSLFNPYFGSLFRTHHNPTYLSRRLSRFADIYTSALSNLLPYSLNHTFYPGRSSLPHEWKIPGSVLVH